LEARFEILFFLPIGNRGSATSDSLISVSDFLLESAIRNCL
jgi:hypothetical protein